MTSNTERKYLTINDIQKQYLPISQKKLREFVKKHLPIHYIGRRIYVERIALEALLSCAANEQSPLD